MSFSPSWITALSWQRGLHNSMKLWAMPWRATKDGWVMVKSSDKTRSTGGQNGKLLQYSYCENPMNRQKDRTLKHELPRLVGAQYATGDRWRKNSRKNEGWRLKWNLSWLRKMKQCGLSCTQSLGSEFQILGRNSHKYSQVSFFAVVILPSWDTYF